MCKAYIEIKKKKNKTLLRVIPAVTNGDRCPMATCQKTYGGRTHLPQTDRWYGTKSTSHKENLINETSSKFNYFLL